MWVTQVVIRGILFDYGGTLDGGVHWLERFAQVYRAAGVPLEFERLRAAFDYATSRAYADSALAGYGLQALIEYHVARQFEHLGLTHVAGPTIVTEFVRASRVGLEESRAILSRLHPHVALGVISNFYGNVERILHDAQLGPLLSTVVDSAVVGVRKPDPAIFGIAVHRLGCEPGEVLYVGDSFEKDMVGAHAAGLRTGWLIGPRERPCPRPECVDVRLRQLADLEPLVAEWRQAGAQTAVTNACGRV